MNNESFLVMQLKEQLHANLAAIPWLTHCEIKETASLAQSGWDLKLSTSHNGQTTSLLVECKTSLTPGDFLRLSHHQRIPTSGIPVLAMPRVSPRLAELCQENGWGWFDLSGNCHLEIPGSLYIERTGRPPVQLEKEQEANLGTPEASRVIRALLSPEKAGQRWTQRDMVTHLENLRNGRAPSLALVNKVAQSLKNQAYVEYLPDRGFRVTDPARLLKTWCDAYPYKRHHRQRYFTLLQGRALQERLTKLEGGVCYMGFSAADFQAANVRQLRTWLFVVAEFEQHFRELLEAKVVDSGENLVVTLPFERGVFDALELSEKRLPCTNPVQTYLDLVHSGGRGDEAAQAVLEQRLMPAWQKGSPSNGT